MAGFYQMVRGKTRSWPGVPDSLIDQCWMNCPTRLVYLKNLERSYSDHNLLLLSIRMKESIEDRHDTVSRDRSNWDPVEYNRLVGQIDWSPMLQSIDIDMANNFLETELLKILDKMIPMKNYQSRKSPSNWLEKDTMELMKKRDLQKQKAKISMKEEDWTFFIKLRNYCVKKVKNYKNEHFKKLYEKIKSESDVKGMYKPAI